MKKGDTVGGPTFRVTRARAASMGSEPPIESQTRVLRKNPKRSIQDENNNNSTTNGAQNKRRTVFKDVTNICRDNSYKNCIIPAKIPKKNSMLTKKNQVNKSKVKSQQVSEKLTVSSKPEIINIDSDHNDLQMCSLYAHDIYNNLRVAELMHRPHFNFMETIQRDVTQSMRGVLVDWLVEVSMEYKLEVDTLYLTVHLIDSFLSQEYIERQKLQLLGITCMLIASKYEEMSAPAIDEFCFITDNTYTKSEVVEMESQVLKNVNFQLSTPTVTTFLRRFLRAAQASHQIPNLELEFLANYLAELTLIDYHFLVFVPSNIAASVVFLARWMLDQLNHPWNDTLKHYTSYKALDLKITVLALHHLHSSDSNSPLNVIRSKYKQEKFKCVASLPSRELPETLF